MESVVRSNTKNVLACNIMWITCYRKEVCFDLKTVCLFTYNHNLQCNRLLSESKRESVRSADAPQMPIGKRCVHTLTSNQYDQSEGNVCQVDIKCAIILHTSNMCRYSAHSIYAHLVDSYKHVISLAHGH
jgi:hypothetical protein